MATVIFTEDAYAALKETAQAILDLANAPDEAAKSAIRKRFHRDGDIPPLPGLKVLSDAAATLAAVPQQFGVARGPGSTNTNHGQGGITISYTPEEQQAMATQTTPAVAIPAADPAYNVHIHLHLPKACA